MKYFSKNRQKQNESGISQHLRLSVLTNICHRQIISNVSAGFTVIELLIATAVFSFILLISLTGFLQIGQLFYKGVTITRTQDSTRQALDSLTSDIRFASKISQSQPQNTAPTGRTSKYFCAGSNRYTFVPGRMVDSSDYPAVFNSQTEDKFGLIKDTLLVSTSCASPFGPGAVAFNEPVELLSNKMRVGELKICQVGMLTTIDCPGGPLNPNLNNLYTVSVIIAYGNDNILQDPTTASVACNSDLSTSQYCHVSKLRTTVRRGF